MPKNEKKNKDLMSTQARFGCFCPVYSLACFDAWCQVLLAASGLAEFYKYFDQALIKS